MVEVARHPRSYDKGRRFESEGHLAGLAKEKRHAAQARSRDVLKASLKNADAFFAALCLRDKSLSHEAARLTKLVSKYNAADVDAAMSEALAKHSVLRRQTTVVGGSHESGLALADRMPRGSTPGLG